MHPNTTKSTFENLYQVNNKQIFSHLGKRNSHFVWEQIRNCEMQLQWIDLWNNNNNNNNNALVSHTVSTTGKMGYQKYGGFSKVDFVVLGCNLERNNLRQAMIESTIIGFPSDIIKEILNYLHQNLYL